MARNPKVGMFMTLSGYARIVGSGHRLKAIQKIDAWEMTPQDGKDFINVMIDVFGEMNRIMIITHKGYFDTGRYYGNTNKRNGHKSERGN